MNLGDTTTNITSSRGAITSNGAVSTQQQDSQRGTIDTREVQFEWQLDSMGAWGWLLMLWSILFFGIVVLLLVAISRAIWWGMIAAGLGLVIVGGSCCYTYVRLWARKRADANRALNDDGQEPTSAVIDRMLRRTPAMFRVRMLRFLAKECGRRGRVGVAIRICPRDDRDTIFPLTETFEPKPLDEAETAFDELRSASDDSAKGAASSERRQRMQPDERAFWSRLRRNVSIRGGWGGFLISGILLAAWTYSRGGVTNYYWWMFYFGVVISWFAIPPGFWLRFANQWYLVPGGVIFRRTRTIRAVPEVHLFVPSESVLCVAVHTFGKWMLVVADRQSQGRTYLTKREALFLLRAWFSKVPPPSRELVEALR